MAYDAFLMIDGIQGDATAAGCEGGVEVYGFDFGVHNDANVGSTGTGTRAGKAEFSVFTAMKKTDSASAPLFQACAMGKGYDKITCLIRASGGDQQIICELCFENVFVTDYRMNGANGGPSNAPDETVSFCYGRVTYTFNKLSADGTPGGTAVVRYDLEKVQAA